MLWLEVISIISYYYYSWTVECQGLGEAGQDLEKEMVCEVCVFQSSAERPSALQLSRFMLLHPLGCVLQFASEAPKTWLWWWWDHWAQAQGERLIGPALSSPYVSQKPLERQWQKCLHTTPSWHPGEPHRFPGGPGKNERTTKGAPKNSCLLSQTFQRDFLSVDSVLTLGCGSWDGRGSLHLICFIPITH